MKTDPISQDHATRLFEIMNTLERVVAACRLNSLTREVTSSDFLFNQHKAIIRDAEDARESAFRVLYGNGWDTVKTSPGVTSLVSRTKSLHQSLEFAGSVGEGEIRDEANQIPYQKTVTEGKKRVTKRIRTKK